MTWFSSLAFLLPLVAVVSCQWSVVKPAKTLLWLPLPFQALLFWQKFIKNQVETSYYLFHTGRDGN
jgi:hypothetical protein